MFVALENVRPLSANESAGYGCHVCLPDEALEEVVIFLYDFTTILRAKRE